MTAPDRSSLPANILARLGFSADAFSLMLVARRPATVLWASDTALADFGAQDTAALGADLFRRDAASIAFAARLARLPSTGAYRLERLTRAGHAPPIVFACHPVEDDGQSLLMLQVRSGAASPKPAPGLAAAPAVADPAGPVRAPAVTRILWETNEAGIVTRIDAEARILGAGAPRPGDDLPGRLRPMAPLLAEQVAVAAREQGSNGRGSVSLTRFDWPVDGAEPRLLVEAGCAPKRGGMPGLRGFFAVHGVAAMTAHPEAVAAPDDAVLPIKAAVETAPTVEPEPIGDVIPVTDAKSVAPEPTPLPLPAPPVGGFLGNVVHFPVMRLGPVPATFVPALHPSAKPGPRAPDMADMAEPQWSEAPPAGLDPDDDTVELSASERDAFEHIRKVLGTRPFAPPPPPSDAAGEPVAAPGLLPGLPRSVGDALVGHGLDAADARDAGAALHDPIVPDTAAQPPGQTTVENSLPTAAAVSPNEPARAPDAPRWTADMLDLVTDGHLRLDDTGAIRELSAKAARLLGTEPEAMIGRPFATFLFEGQTPGWQALAAAAIAPEAPPQGPNPIRLRSSDGQPVAVLLRLGRSGGTLIGTLTLDRPAAVPANDTAEVARREAERTNALKSEFLAKVSHEIRTPLNAILGFTEVIRDERLGPVGNPRYLEYLRDIHASGTHVMSLVNDLLDLSRIEAGRMDLDLQAVDANAVVQGCVNTLQTQAHGERIIVRLSLTPRLPPTLADERSLRQIVLNLLSNAIKFNEPGGQVIVSTALAGPDAVAIRIRDTGIGMSEDEIATAMEPFRQLSTANRTGSGLGLPLTKALVEANCASMAIKSTRGEGTLVEVTFPLVEQDSMSLPAE